MVVRLLPNDSWFQARVINAATDDASLEKGAHLGYLEEIAVVADESIDHDEQPIDAKHLLSIFNTVDQTMPETDRG